MRRAIWYILPEGECAATYDGPPVPLFDSPQDLARIGAWQEERIRRLRRGDPSFSHVAVSRIWPDGRITEWHNPMDSEEITVSTVFMNVDHGYSVYLDEGMPPVLWETLPFRNGASLDRWQERYTSRREAVAGHLRICAEVSRWVVAGMPDEWEDESEDDALSLPCGCHRLPALACAAVRMDADPFAPFAGDACDCACHGGGVVVDAGKEQGA